MCFRSRLILFVFAPVLCVAAGCQHGPTGRALTSEALSAHGPSTDPRRTKSLLYYSNDLIQLAKFTLGEENVRFQSSERQPGDKIPTLTYSVEFGTSYDVIDVISGGQSHLLYVVGVGRGGSVIVERWEIEEQAGAYYAERPLTAQLVGRPLASPPIAQGILGGQWVYPPNRSGSVTANRSEVYRGTDFEGVLSAAADPDGRFVILLALQSPSVRELYRVDSTANPSPPVLLADASSFDAIGRAQFVYLRELVTGERVVVVEAFGAPVSKRCMLFDLGNDGLFDPPFVVDNDQWIGFGFNKDSMWSTDFVTY